MLIFRDSLHGNFELMHVGIVESNNLNLCAGSDNSQRKFT